jgi:lipoprotein-anchoring transpeptidase ErfK/SrfK
MRSRHPKLSRAGRRTPLVLALALVLLVVLAGTVWAAWGATWRTGLNALRGAQVTVTPTRTPRPELATVTVTVVEPVIVAFTATPVPAAPAVPPAADGTPEPMPADLAGVVARYGMDSSRRFIVVDLATQKMRIWDPMAGPAMDGKPLRELPVSTGDEAAGYRTPPWYGLVGKYEGTFQSFGVYADEGWYLFEDHGSILIHSAPYKLVDGQKVYEEMDALGAYPASHGCIRLSPEDAAWFTAWNPQGVPLVILPK